MQRDRTGAAQSKAIPERIVTWATVDHHQGTRSHDLPASVSPAAIDRRTVDSAATKAKRPSQKTRGAQIQLTRGSLKHGPAWRQIQALHKLRKT